MALEHEEDCPTLADVRGELRAVRAGARPADDMSDRARYALLEHYQGTIGRPCPSCGIRSDGSEMEVA